MTEQLEITEAGVYDMAPAAYHADPVPGGSLSQSGAKLLLPPSCPALFRWDRDHPRAPKREFDLGHAAHREVLGAGADMAVIDAANYLTKAAKQARDEAYAEGKTPVLPKELEQVQAMAKAVREHPIAGRLFEPGTGKPENALFWEDKATGVWRRSLLDWLPEYADPRPQRLIIPDYKSARSASPEKIQKAIVDHGYHIQAQFYLDGVRALELHPDPVFLFVFQEKDPPYLVTVAEPDAESLRIAAIEIRNALHIYRRCVETNTWPGYSDDVELISLPPWLEKQYQETP